jgi:hypothetical protein
MNKTWKVVLGVVLIFLFGWLCGSFSTAIFLHHRMLVTLRRGPEGLADAVQRPLTRGMNLDDDQKTKFHAALVSYFRERWALQKEIQPEIANLNEEALQEVDAFLKPDQQQRLLDNVKRLQTATGRNLFGSGPDQAASPVGATNAGSPAPPK